MSRILVLYGTTDGQTAKIATFLGEEFRAFGVDADVVRAAPGSPGPESYDGVVVAASIQAGGFQRPVRRWVRTHAEALRHKPAAFLAVCLGVLEHDPKTDAQLSRIVNRFADQSRWTPPELLVVAGALRWTRYGWLKRWVMRRIVAKVGGDLDTSRDHEYTDWAELRRFVATFVRTSRTHVEPMSVHEASEELRRVPVG